jgi:hypothetical protein
VANEKGGKLKCLGGVPMRVVCSFPKKSCLDGVRNSIARCAAQIHAGHWRSALNLKGIKKRQEDKCWFCQGRHRMTRSHVLPHCPNARVRAARVEAWDDKEPGSIRVLLSNPQWEKRLLRFLELSGVGRVMEDGVDEEEVRAGRLGHWISWEVEEWVVPRAPE